MKKFFLGLLFIGCMALSHANQSREMTLYHSPKFGFSLEYPSNWLLVPDEANNYIALYHPKSLSHQKQTLELISGLKIEILPIADFSEIITYLKENQMNKIPGNYEQYVLRDKRCYYLATVISGPKWNYLILGYFPEKKKEAVYLPLYQKIVQSFKLN
ncbi:MAG: hypothetical protein NTX82_06225 [Candidatus Parcubacteria bacterium]|nr:hypothetical protein [Candidatus Parcubacteria bacterium]